MIWRKSGVILLAMLVLFLVGCASQKDLQAAYRTVDTLEAEVAQLKEGVPPAVYKALATYVFHEFRQGRPPVDLITGDRVSFSILREGANTDPVPPNQVDFKPILDWFQRHPTAEVESIEIWPKSHNDRVWMNLKSTDGFYVRIAFRAYGLSAFGISETPLSWE